MRSQRGVHAQTYFKTHTLFHEYMYVIENKLNAHKAGTKTQKAQKDGQNEEEEEEEAHREWRDEGKVWNQLGDWAKAACILVGVSQA